MSNGNLTDGLLEAKHYLEELQGASYQNFDDVLKRYAYVLRDDGEVGEALKKVLPEVEFEEWYEEAKGTRGGMVGSAKLSWPVDRSRRVALQLELVRRFGSGDVNALDFANTFTHVDRKFDYNLEALVRRVLVPFHRDLLLELKPILTEQEEEPDASPETRTLPYNFIDPTRLAQLRGLHPEAHDLRRLVRYCEELDFCFRNRCFLAVAALTRALLDHVAPIFGMNTFAEVANNYAGGKSFKESMAHLESSARKIGDAHLHQQIRKREVLPTATQVDFSSDIDVLLGEIVRIMG